MTKINDEQLRILAYVAEHPNVSAADAYLVMGDAVYHRLYQLYMRGFIARQPSMLKGIGNGYKITLRGEEVLAEHAARVDVLL